MKKNGKIIAIVLGIVAIVTVAVMLTSLGKVTVNFDSSGGTAVERVTVAKGTSLGKLPEPQRGGYNFLGWFYETSNLNYLEEDVITEDTTLHAEWVKTSQENHNVDYLGDVDPAASFIVASSVKLTDENLSQYISFTCFDAPMPAIKVTPNGVNYEIKAVEDFQPGSTYQISILDGSINSFISLADIDVMASDILTYTFSIAKEDVYNVVKKDNIKFVSNTKLLKMVDLGKATIESTGQDYDVGKTIYGAYIKGLDETVAVGDIINLAFNDPNDFNAQYYRILSIDFNSSYKGETVAYLTLIAPDLSEIYDELEMYSSNESLDLGSLIENKDNIIAQVSEQVNATNSAYAGILGQVTAGLKASPTVQTAIKDFSQEEKNAFYSLTSEKVFNSPAIVNFGIIQSGQGAGIEIVITTGDIILDLGHNIQVGLNFTIKDNVFVDGFHNLKHFAFKGYFINAGVDITNQFTFSLQASISFNKTDKDSKTTDISQELQNIIENTNPTQAYADELNKGYMKENLEYQDVANADLGSVQYVIGGVLCIKIDLQAVVSVGCYATIDFNTEYSTVYRIGNRNGYIDRRGDFQRNSWGAMSTYNGVVKSNLSVDFSFKGKIGIRAGLRVSVTFSIFGLYDTHCIGFSSEVGAYLELSGFVDINGDNVRGYFVYEVKGGLKLEIGIYISINVYWKFWPWEGSHSIYHNKFPLFTIQTDQEVKAFESIEDEVVINTKEFNLATEEFLKVSTVNMHGPTINGAETAIVTSQVLDPTRCFFNLTSSDRSKEGYTDIRNYVWITKDGYIKIAEDAPERIDFDVKITYLDGKSVLSNNSSNLEKVVHVTYVDFEGDTNQKYNVAFHGLDGEVVATHEYFVGQKVFVPSWNEVFKDRIYSDIYVIDYDNFWVTKDGEPYDETIHEDRDYYINYTDRYYDVVYSAMVYVEDGDYYSYGNVATISVPFRSEAPTPPDISNIEKRSYYEFYEWQEERFITFYENGVEYRLCTLYTALYTDTRHRISFSGGGEFITVLVEDGEMPEVPNMSDFERDGYTISGWSPEIKPATEDTIYYAMYTKDYKAVTFKDRYGNVIETQNVKRGEQPILPNVPQIYKGEEPYIEYYFTGWSPKIDVNNLEDTYNAQYKKRFIECTMVFDPEEYTLAYDAESIYTGSYNPTLSDNPLFLVPTIASFRDNRYNYTLSKWKCTTKFNGYYQEFIPDSSYNYAYTGTYKPIFTKTDITYQIEFSADGKYLKLTGKYGDTITEDMLHSTFAKEPDENYTYKASYGVNLPYTFGSEIGEDGYGIISKSCMVTYVSEDKMLVATLDPNGGEFEDGSTENLQISGPYFSSITFPSNLNRLGYTFAGWSTDPDATSGSSDSFNIIQDVTFYAIWQPEEIVIKFDVKTNNGHFTDDSLTANGMEIIGDYGTYVESNEAFNTAYKDDENGIVYDFVGWNTDATAFTGIAATEIEFKTNTTYYAIFVEHDMLFISFDPGEDAYIYDYWCGGYGAWKYNLSIKCPKNGSLAFEAWPEDALIPRKPSDIVDTYVFDGWYDEQGTKLTFDKVFTENTTYTARYTKKYKMFKVEFTYMYDDDYCFFIKNGQMLNSDPMNSEELAARLQGATIHFTDGSGVTKKSVEGTCGTKVYMSKQDIEVRLELQDGTTYTTQTFYSVLPEQVTDVGLERFSTYYGWQFLIRSYTNTIYGNITQESIEYTPGSFSLGAAAIRLCDEDTQSINFVSGSVEGDDLVFTDEQQDFVLQFVPVFVIEE